LRVGASARWTVRSSAAAKAKVYKKRPDMLSRMGSQTTPIVSM
jgi:hypothetical protein